MRDFVTGAFIIILFSRFIYAAAFISTLLLFIVKL